MCCDLIPMLLTKDKIKELQDFLVFIYGEEYRRLATSYIDCMFSDDFRKPTFFVSSYNGRIVGVASFSEELFTVNMWGISWVSVHPDFRNRGIGQSLVQKCIIEIKSIAELPVTLILATYPNKTKLYEKIGFKSESYDPKCGAIMTLSLTN